MKVSTNKMGNVVSSSESEKHPDSHFETASVNIEPSDNGGFTVEHRQRLKKMHEGKGGEYYGSYREPKRHVFGNAKAMVAHVKGCFGDKGE